MSYHNYRFHLADDLQHQDLECISEQIKQILNKTTGLELIRIAIDSSTQNNSISLLCKLEDKSAVQNKINVFLVEKGLIVKEVEVEKLEADTTSHCEHNHDHHHEHNHDHHHEHSHGHHHDNHWSKAALGLIWGIGLLVLSLGGFAIPALAYFIITGLTALMTLYLGRTVYQSAWRALREKRWDMTTLYAISTLTIFTVSILSMFIPGLPMMFEAAPFVLGFWHLGEGIEHTLIDSINKKLDVRESLSPLVLLKGNPDTETPIKTLIPNDLITITKGTIIPVDGVLTTSALLYTTRINGSPHPKILHPGDAVKAGMYLADTDNASSIEIRVTKTYQNSYLSLIAKNIKKANDEKAPIELFANKVLKYFIPGLLGIALISGLIISFFFTPVLAIECVIAVLVSACPCALSLITPMAVKIGMKKASEQGVHFNNGKTLQAAADIDTVVFDLNGTLTQGENTVSSLTISDKKFLKYVALLEKHSNHHVAKAIKSYIEKEGIIADEQLELTDLDTKHHSGIKGKINSEVFIIGNQQMLVDNGISINTPYNNPENGSVYIVRGTMVIGQINLNDPLRADAIATVKQLQRKGKSVHICTGSDQISAEKYAALLGIPKSNICANTVGIVTNSNEISKTNYIRLLQDKNCKVAMIGDALNDAEAVAYASIGIAVKSSIGDQITQENADIVIQQGLLFPIATAFDTAEKTKKNIVQNLFVSLTYNSIVTLIASGLFIALGFTLNPAVGVALMVLESTIVLANLYRFKQQKVLSAESNLNAKPDKTGSESTTSKILNALGHCLQPESSATNKQEPAMNLSKSGAFFEPSINPGSIVTKNSFEPVK